MAKKYLKGCKPSVIDLSVVYTGCDIITCTGATIENGMSLKEIIVLLAQDCYEPESVSWGDIIGDIEEQTDLVQFIQSQLPSVSWGNISGDINEQTDLTALIESFVPGWGDLTGDIESQQDLINYLSDNFYDKEVIDNKINDVADKSTAEYYRLAEGVTTLPTNPEQGGVELTNAWTWLVPGVTYTVNGTPITTPDDRNTRADWDGASWSLVDMGELPTIPIAPVVIEGGEEAVSQDAVYGYVEDKTSRLYLYEEMQLPDPFGTVILHNILNRNNFDQIWGGGTGTTSVMTVENNVGTYTAIATNGNKTSNITGTSIGDRIYVKIDVKSDSDEVYVYMPGRPMLEHTSGTGEWESLSFIISASAEPNSSLRVQDTRDSGWTPVSLRKGVAINLTAVFGEGNEPSIEQIEATLSNLPYMWFEDTLEYVDPLITEGMTFVNKGGVMVMGYPPQGESLKVVCFGDSITEFGDYPSQVGRRTGYDVINVGIGGTRLTDRGNPEYYDDLTFTKLVDAITSGDFTAQDAAIVHLSARAQERYSVLKAIDWATVDIIVFMYGTNDYATTGLAMGDDDDTVTYRNFKGGINHVLTKLSESFPHIRLYAVTPIFRLRDGYDNSDDAPGASGLYLYDLAQAIVDLSKKYHIPCLDLYNSSGINKYNALEYIVDGTHPTLKGYDLIAKKISEFIITK